MSARAPRDPAFLPLLTRGADSEPKTCLLLLGLHLFQLKASLARLVLVNQSAAAAASLRGRKSTAARVSGACGRCCGWKRGRRKRNAAHTCARIRRSIAPSISCGCNGLSRSTYLSSARLSLSVPTPWGWKATVSAGVFTN